MRFADVLRDTGSLLAGPVGSVSLTHPWRMGAAFRDAGFHHRAARPHAVLVSSAHMWLCSDAGKVHHLVSSVGKILRTRSRDPLCKSPDAKQAES